jgi:CRP/FNR family transcriptional regulator, cyclic AMP receptor protein
MKATPIPQHSDAFALLQKHLASYSIPPSLTAEILERQIPVNFEKCAMVFSEGSTDDLLACLLSGYVKVYCPISDGGRTLMRLATPGELIGYAEYLDERGKRARMFEAVCSSKCTVALISRDRVARLLNELSPDSLIGILESLNRFWSFRVRWFATLLSLPFCARLEIVLADLAARAGVKDSRGTILLPELAHEDLAEMIGCSRPMVSRIVGEMTEQDLIARNGKNYVLLGNWDLDRFQTRLTPRQGKLVRINSNGRDPRSNGHHHSGRATADNEERF